MSQPVLVEAIQNEFVPMIVHNNKGGRDAELLKRFREPSWNNPVVRFISADGKDVVARRARVWSEAGIAKRMVLALEAAQRPVPAYLQLHLDSLTKKTATATFAMHCYWEGEVRLGAIDGVTSTRSAWQSGLEVVSVEYQPEVVDYEKLLVTAKSLSCASRVFAHNDKQFEIAKELVGNDAVRLPKNAVVRDAKLSDQKFYLARTPLIHLPLTETQATKLNAAVKKRSGYRRWLSPSQQRMLQQILRIKKTSPAALASFRYPRDAKQLAPYRQRLEQQLAKSN
jgi:hypothetical protein